MHSNLDPGYTDYLTIEKQLEYIVVKELLNTKEKWKRSVTIPEMYELLTSKDYAQLFSGEKKQPSFRNKLEQVFQELRENNIFTAAKKATPLSKSDKRAKKYKYSKTKLKDYYRNELIRELADQLNLETDSANIDGIANGTHNPSAKLILREDDIKELTQEIWEISRAEGEI